MKHIKNLYIGNFQSHRDTDLNFHPGINVIVGETDVGKSAIIRALTWVFRNAPDGDKFWNEAARVEKENCWVQATIADDIAREWKVVRERGSGNRYVLARDGEDPVEFTGFGRGTVPEDIRHVVGDLVSFGKGLSCDISIGKQSDPPFLVASHSPKQFASILGKLTGILALDRAEQIGNRSMKRLRSEADFLQKEYDTEAEKTFPDPVAVERSIKAAQAAADKVEQLEDRVLELRGLIDDFTALEAKFRGQKDNLDWAGYAISLALKAFDGIDAEKANQLMTAKQALVNAVTAADSAYDDVALRAEDVRRAEDALNSHLAITDVCPLSGGEFFDVCKAVIKGENDGQTGPRDSNSVGHVR